jgi:transposase
MELYAVEGRSIDEVAKAVDVPGRTVAMWVYNGQWDVLAKREVSARQAQSALELARMRADRRIEIAKEQFEQAKEIREKAMSRIRDDEGSLKANAEAWTAAAKVEHTLSGVSEAGTLAEAAEREDGAKKDGGKQPLVVVIQGGGLPPVRRHG